MREDSEAEEGFNQAVNWQAQLAGLAQGGQANLGQTGQNWGHVITTNATSPTYTLANVSTPSVSYMASSLVNK
jgi:hypothetical protein